MGSRHGQNQPDELRDALNLEEGVEENENNVIEMEDTETSL